MGELEIQTAVAGIERMVNRRLLLLLGITEIGPYLMMNRP